MLDIPLLFLSLIFYTVLVSRCHTHTHVARVHPHQNLSLRSCPPPCPYLVPRGFATARSFFYYEVSFWKRISQFFLCLHVFVSCLSLPIHSTCLPGANQKKQRNTHTDTRATQRENPLSVEPIWPLGREPHSFCIVGQKEAIDPPPILLICSFPHQIPFISLIPPPHPFLPQHLVWPRGSHGDNNSNQHKHNNPTTPPLPLCPRIPTLQAVDICPHTRVYTLLPETRPFPFSNLPPPPSKRKKISTSKYFIFFCSLLFLTHTRAQYRMLGPFISPPPSLSPLPPNPSNFSIFFLRVVFFIRADHALSSLLPPPPPIFLLFVTTKLLALHANCKKKNTQATSNKQPEKKNPPLPLEKKHTTLRFSCLFSYSLLPRFSFPFFSLWSSTALS
eukprot:Rhum_TRINITY_DN14832_c8_g1::Rhum_TRINITY_DN14832_c8_g1_i1::g.124738::m.124738